MSSRFIRPSLSPYEQVVQYFLAPEPSRSLVDPLQEPGSRRRSECVVGSHAWSFDDDVREDILHDAVLRTAGRVCAPHLPPVRVWYAIFVFQVKSEVFRRLTARQVRPHVIALEDEPAPEPDVFAAEVVAILPGVVDDVLNPEQRWVWDAYVDAAVRGVTLSEALGEPHRSRHSKMQHKNRIRVWREIERRLAA